MRKETAMRTKVVLLAFASGLAGCQYTPHDLADRGVAAVNVPVVSRSDYVFDVSAPGGMLSPSDTPRSAATSTPPCLRASLPMKTSLSE